jgi:hypothetical protein
MRESEYRMTEEAGEDNNRRALTDESDTRAM